ncbi:MAG: hypothetical protein NWF08_06245 [Candidatus Bathyarchaeota archaeon]|nr:hypothetical protein [Candidatus Bathyarchaeota archaeon]
MKNSDTTTVVIVIFFVVLGFIVITNPSFKDMTRDTMTNLEEGAQHTDIEVVSFEIESDPNIPGNVITHLVLRNKGESSYFNVQYYSNNVAILGESYYLESGDVTMFTENFSNIFSEEIDYKVNEQGRGNNIR